MNTEGLILKGIGGFYYVKTAEGLVTCRARGSLRRDKITPCIGDRAIVSYKDIEDGVVEEILPRKNVLARPPIANIDKLFILASTTAPSPNTLIIDKTIAVAEIKNIEPILVITKTDLECFDELKLIYEGAGIRVICVSSLKRDGIGEILAELHGCFSAFTGNSGVGKSTLLNSLLPELSLETGEISKKLGRGRHTTRHVELFPVEGGGYVADTPGFSTLDTERFERIRKEELADGFREFAPFRQDCKFTSCTHTCEKGCAVLMALENGLIHKSRFASYMSIYNEVKDVKEWQTQKNV